MDSMVDVLSEQPWGQTYTEWHDGIYNESLWSTATYSN